MGGLLGSPGQQHASSGPGKSGSAPGHTGAAPGLSHASKDLQPLLNKDQFEEGPPKASKEDKKTAKEAEKSDDGKSTEGGDDDSKGVQAPVGPPEIVGRKAVAGKTPWVSQLEPAGKDTSYLNGEQNCAPAVAAMVARNAGYGKDLTDSQLIMHLGEVGGTTNQGTSGNGLIAMYNQMGMDTNATAGANLDWMRAELQAGRHVNVLGDFYEVPGRIDGAQSAGHYLNVTGMTLGGDFLVQDPWDPNVTQLTAAQLQNFITSGPQGGFAVSAWNPIGAPVAG
ncbi:MAG TPA: C39 family peptidase [Myxococcales bacterium]|nr:C39 family peptidase [Myxococcales bacterium]